MKRDLPDLPPVPEFDLDDVAPETARELVAEAFHTFGEDAAEALADRLGVQIADCTDDIERLRHRLH